MFFLEKTDDSLDANRDIGTGVGFDNCSNRSRLGFVHDNHGLAQVHEVGVTFFGRRGRCT